MTLRAEHIKERRQPRHDAYKAFIQSTFALKESVLSCDVYEDPTLEEENRLRSEITAQWTDLVLLGPKSVNMLGSVLHDAALDVIRQMGAARYILHFALHIRHANEDEEDAYREAYEDSLNNLRSLAEQLGLAINAFAAVASTLLEDDGTKQRRARFWKRRRSLPPATLVRE